MNTLNKYRLMSEALSRKTNNKCKVKNSTCAKLGKNGICKLLTEMNKRCTGLAGIVIDNTKGIITDTLTDTELTLTVYELLTINRNKTTF